MKVVEPGSSSGGLLARCTSILLHPLATWDVIAGEEVGVGELYRAYVAPLAAIPALCGALAILGSGGVRIFGIRLMPSIGAIIGEMLGRYVLTLLGVYGLALVLDALAPRFGGQPSRTQAFKLAAYSGTAAWVAGVFLLLPAVGGLVAFLGGLYSLYLLYLGLPKLMQPEPSRAMPYYFVTLALAFLFMVLTVIATSYLSGLGGPVTI